MWLLIDDVRDLNTDAIARTPEAGQRLLAALRQHGIKLRDCTSFGLPGAVRLGVLQPASQDALQTAWQTVHVGGP